MRMALIMMFSVEAGRIRRPRKGWAAQRLRARLECQQPALGGEPVAAGVAAEMRGGDHAVARDDDRDRVAAVGLADRARDCRRRRARCRGSCASRRTGSRTAPARRAAGRRCPPGASGRSNAVSSPSKYAWSCSRARRSSGVSVCSLPQPQSTATIAPSSSETERSPIGVWSESCGTAANGSARARRLSREGSAAGRLRPARHSLMA